MDQRNLLIAVVASIAILLGWQFMFEQPRLEKQAAERKIAEEQAANQQAMAPIAQPGVLLPTAPSTPQSGTVTLPSVSGGVQIPGAPVVGVPGETLVPMRASVIQKSPRITIANTRVHGSISLKGGQIDDLILNDYRETIDEESPQITLLSPSGAEKPYFAQFGWVGSDSSIRLPNAETIWKSDRPSLSAKAPVTLSWDNGQGLLFTRVITLDENFMFTITQRVQNSSNKSMTLFPYGLVSRTSTPDTLGFFILHEGLLGVFDGQLKEVDYDDLQDEGNIKQKTTGGWLGITDKYWLVALVPDQKAKFDTAFRHSLLNKTDKYQVDYLGAGLIMQPGANIEVSNRLFAGAKQVSLLDTYNEDLQIARFDLAIDFGWFYFLTKPIFYVLDYFNDLLGNFGLAILLLTVIIKLIFFPLANKSYKAMSRMKALQPKIVKLRERYPDDRAKQNEAMMQLYKKEKVNPAAGCFPMLIQIPVFFALYKVLFVSIEMRQAPFYGWIQDLSAPDPTSIFTLFGAIPWSPPEFLLIGIWPVIMGVTMFLQQKLNPAPADPMQARIFMFLPIMFTFMLARFPAGLVIYWAWNNLLSITQQYVIMRRMGVKVSGGT
jgi:YidC/Oxa1 family membrane protein insertase